MPQHQAGFIPMMQSQNKDTTQRGDGMGKDKRKPVRRDPEKRRQQNIQAQRKYREKLRERLDHLEKIAAQNGAIENGAGPSPPVVTSQALSTTAHTLPVVQDADGSVATTPGEYHYPSPSDTSSELSLWDSTTYVDPTHLIRDKYNNDLGFCWTTNVQCGCSRPHIQVNTQAGEVKMISVGMAPPNPYANNLRIETICVTGALYALGMLVGISEEAMCADESLSPFFRAGAASGDELVTSSTVGTVQSIFKTLKPDLRPSTEQITVEHHPYIDILPFPTLRKNLIIHQKEIDDDEFFHDMLTGLVCWGGAGVGRRDRERSTGFVSTGTPWDVRSWEARVWFIKKYWDLLGGEDGELVRQSEWWRSMRGEMVDVGPGS